MLKPTQLILGLAIFVPTLFQTSAQGQAAPQIPITTIVTVLGPKFTDPPPIAKEDVTVFSGKTKLDVVDWVPAQGENGAPQLAILVDNSANLFRTGVELLNELAGFVTSQSKGTQVGVFYAFGGTVQVASPFSTNHEAAAMALRMPDGSRAANSPTVFNSLTDLVNHHWESAGTGREVLLISSGADGMNRGPSSPYVQGTIEDIQRAGVVVYAIYFNGGVFDQSMSGEIAQGNLRELTQESGGYNLFDGVSMPMSYSSYLRQLQTALRHQYRLTFDIAPIGKAKGELREIKIRTEQHHVDLKYPKQVFVPGTAK